MRRSILALFIAAISANAASIFTAGQNAGTTLDAVDLTGFSTTGNMMGGMTITGSFAGGISAVCTWVNGGGNAGGCTASNSGSGFHLALDGDTFTASWFLTSILGTHNLLSLSFDGPVGFTVFDRPAGLFGLGDGTDGSSLGRDMSGNTSSAIGGSATYNDQVATMGNPAVGDIYAHVLLTFDGAGLAPGSTADWIMDTDNIGLRNGEPGSGTPEPGTFGLMGAALVGLAAVARSKRRSS